MNTYSHFIITLFVDRNARRREASAIATGKPLRLPPVKSAALLWGSVAPDIPLILIAIGAMLVDLVTGNRWEPGSGAASSAVGTLFSDLFFTDPWVKAAHNLFHAPLLVAAYVAVGYWAWRRAYRWGAILFWFGLACALHTAIDIPLHTNDGPLLLFPFNWDLRFYSPVSYWDPARYGVQFAYFEHGLVVVMLVRLGIDGWRKARRGGARSASG